MDNLLSLRRSALIYGLCLPLAIFLGYSLAQPAAFKTRAFLALLFGVLSVPMFLRWHHPLLVLSWNAALVVPFVPGQPNWWMGLSFVSFSFAVLLRIITKKGEFLSAPSVTFWILVLLVTISVTAYATGGMGARVMGTSAFGGRRYLYVFSAIAGYFALIGTRIRPAHAILLVSGFFLSGVTTAVSDLAYAAGSKFYFLYYLFPSEYAAGLAAGEQSDFPRFGGTSFAAQSAILALLARYGLRGVLDWTRPWRTAVFALLLGASMFGGFRSVLIVLLFFIAFQFYFERLASLRNVAVLCAGLLLLMAIAVGFGTKLPIAVQRTLSFLPVQVDERVRRDAGGTTEGRWLMWKTLLPEVPKYLWLGKGFTFSGTDMYLTEEAMRRGFYPSYEVSLVTGSYHNGILTVLILFGSCRSPARLRM